MSSPCTNNPTEVIDKVVSSEANADKFNSFVNGTAEETVQLGSGEPTPTLRNAVSKMMADASWAKEHIANAPEGDVSLNNATSLLSTSSRTLAERFSDIVNVKDYGAKGDGTTNDTAAFQAAASAAGTGGVFVPAGTYNVASAVDGFFYSFGDAIVSGGVAVHSLPDMQKSTVMCRALQFLHPFNNETQQAGIVGGLQSCCYDSKRDVFYLGCVNADGDESLAGHIYTFGDLNDLSTPDDSAEVVGGHFNSMDYDAVNDKIWLAPGGSQAGQVLLIDPKTMDATPLSLVSGQNYWQIAIDNENDFAYIVESTGIERYSLSTKQKDTSFAPLSIPSLELAPDETSVGQSMFFYSGMICFIWTVYVAGSGGSFTRVAYACVDIASRESFTATHSVRPQQEIEDIAIKNGTIYAVAQHTDAVGLLTVFSYSLGNANATQRGDRYILENEDFNNFINEGRYNVSTGIKFNTLAHRPAVGAVNGILYVEITGKGGNNIRQIYINANGEIAIRIYDSNAWRDWNLLNTCFSTYRSGSTSLDSIVTSGMFEYTSGLTDAPAGANGFIKNWVARTNNGDGKLIKQFFTRQGTIDSNDHNLYFRSGTYGSSTWTFSAWHKIITEQDYFNNILRPWDDNTYMLGSPQHRWSEVHAGNGAINTSDERVKENIVSPDEKLMRAWGKIGYKIFQFKDAVKKKGANARLHVGVIAQKVQEAFASEDLDAARYGLFCYDEWPDQYDEDVVVDEEAVLDEKGVEIVPAKTHVERKLVQKAGSLYGIRYEEALALECAYQRWLGEQRNARIAELEARLNKLSGNGSAPSGASPDNL